MTPHVLLSIQGILFFASLLMVLYHLAKPNQLNLAIPVLVISIGLMLQFIPL